MVTLKRNKEWIMIDPATGEEYMDNIIKEHMELLEPKITEQYLDDFKIFSKKWTWLHGSAVRKKLRILKKDLGNDFVLSNAHYIQRCVLASMLVCLIVAIAAFVYDNRIVAHFFAGVICLLALISTLAWRHVTQNKMYFNPWVEKQIPTISRIIINGLANESLVYNGSRYEINACISEKFINRYITNNPDELSTDELELIRTHIECMKEMKWTACVSTQDKTTNKPRIVR